MSDFNCSTYSDQKTIKLDFHSVSESFTNPGNGNGENSKMLYARKEKEAVYFITVTA